MSFFEKALSKVGIGAAKVDARIDNPCVSVGDDISGVVHVMGGNIEQEINKIYLKLMTYYMKEVENSGRVKQTVEIAKIELNETFTIRPKETRAIPFSMMIPFETPVSLQKDSVWISTGLDVKLALDPSDKDYLNVVPHPYMGCVLDALCEDLGFRLAKVETEYTGRLGRGLPFVQEFEFRAGGQFRNSLDELEIVFYPDYNGLQMIMEIDRSARGAKGFLLEIMDMDESVIQINIPASEFEKGRRYIADYLYDTIKRRL
ncbi:MAG TPA: sporulation protein [Pseudobacteroides sp.]|uniref:sporulation protein n=1 Tax=Pseudobacteroides sp. TaxID=1968840 RepID=UPI002F921FD2